MIIEKKEFKIYDMEEINKEKYVGFIYITKNLINGKKYIGQHTTWNKKYLGSGVHFLKAVNKYGKENFKRKIIDIAETQNELNEKEIYYIDLFSATIPNNNFYNIASGGEGGNPYDGKTEEELRIIGKKISKANSGENHPLYGKNHSEETRQKMSLAWNNKTEEEMREWKEKISLALSGEKHPLYGKNHTEETIQKMSGKNHFTAKLFYLYKNNELIGEFYTVTEAALELQLKIDGKLGIGITALLNGWIPKRGQMKGYSAKYAEEIVEELKIEIII